MADKVWYVAVAGQQEGPYTEEDVVSRVREGRVGRDAFVFRTGMESWVPIASRDEFSGALGPAPAPPPPGAVAPTAGA
ncbi:MAG: DUF4339 domain-containing protein, partial [Thermoanaerobaculia bacterium]